MKIKKNKEEHVAHEFSESFGDWAYDLSHDDTKRHQWMINLALPLFEVTKPRTVLTLGDARGRECYFLQKFMDVPITASDIGTHKLEEAKKFGYVDDYVEADIEDLHFEDGKFDSTFVKESLHHLPRPILGLYEMLRVSSKAVVLIEPNDAQQTYSVYPEPGSYYDAFEETRNYLYRFSLREIVKIATSLHLKYVVARGFNDPWKENFKYNDWTKERESLDQLGRKGVRQFDLMSIMIITDSDFELSTQDRQILNENDYVIFDLIQLEF